MGEVKLWHEIFLQTRKYLLDNPPLPEDRDEPLEIPIKDPRLDKCNVSTQVSGVNKLLRYTVREKTTSLREKRCLPVCVMGIRKTEPGQGFVVIAPTVGLGSLVG